jgi:hypothetical protein
MKENGTKGGTEASQGKELTLAEKRAATRTLRKLRRLEREHANQLKYKHHVQVMNRVLVCGLVHVAHRYLDILRDSVSYPNCYLANSTGQEKATQAASDLDEVISRLDRELSQVARAEGLV